VAVGYTGTLTFSTSDPDSGVVLPADSTFTADDQGVHTFAADFTLVTPGNQTLTAIDTADDTITGSATVTVDPGPAAPRRPGLRRPARSLPMRFPGMLPGPPQTPSTTRTLPSTQDVPSAAKVASVDRWFARLPQEENPGMVPRLSPAEPGEPHWRIQDLLREEASLLV